MHRTRPGTRRPELPRPRRADTAKHRQMARRAPRRLARARTGLARRRRPGPTARCSAPHRDGHRRRAAPHLPRPRPLPAQGAVADLRRRNPRPRQPGTQPRQPRRPSRAPNRSRTKPNLLDLGKDAVALTGGDVVQRVPGSGVVTGYWMVRGTGAPRSSKAWRWTGVGLASFSMRCPAKLMVCRSRVDRCSSRSRLICPELSGQRICG